MITKCECELAGYCNRHKIKKHRHWNLLCKHDPAYFEAWENGTGPGQIAESDYPEGFQKPSLRVAGPGTVLHKALEKIGITFSSTCSCASHVKKMDAWGPEGCKPKIHVIVGWLKAEAKTRKLPFSVTAANLLVKWAIYKSEQNLAKSKEVGSSSS